LHQKIGPTNLTARQIKEEKVRRVIYSDFDKFFFLYCPSKNYVYDEHTRYLLSECQQIVANIGQGKSTYSIVTLPPLHGKSDIVSRRFPTWYLSRYPSHTVTLVAPHPQSAATFTYENKDLFYGYASKYNLFVRKRHDMFMDWQISDAHGGCYSAGFIGQSVIGITNLLIIDDWHRNFSEAESDVIRNKVWDAFERDFRARMEVNHSILIVGSRWHKDDLVGRILKKQEEDPTFPQFKVKNFASEKQDGSNLSTRFDKLWYNQRKASLGTYLWSAQMQQEPLERRDKVIDVVDDSLDLKEWADKYIEFDDPSPLSKLHEEMAEILSTFDKKRGQKLIVLAPRGSAKTTWLTLLHVLHIALSGRESYILIIGATNEDAKGFINALRMELDQNAQLLEDYPFLMRKHSKEAHFEWSKNRLHLPNGVMIEGRGAVGLRGRKHGQARPSLVIIDDPSNDDHKTSEIKRIKLSKWFKSTLLKIGTRKTNFLFAGTAIHREALAMEVMRMKGWEKIKYQSIIEWPNEKDGLWKEWEIMLMDPSNDESEREAFEFYIENKAKMDEGAVLLWPEREPLYYLMHKRATEGHHSFESEYQNDPIDPESVEWPPECFEGDDIFFKDWPNLSCKVVAMDPSKGLDTKPGDYAATIMLGVGDDGYFYVDADIVRQDATQLVDNFCGILKMFRPQLSAIEANAFQHVLITDVLRVLDDGAVATPPIPIENTVNKQMRIRSLTPYIKFRRFKYKKNSVGVQILLDQLRDFPDPSAHDDGPDALEMAMRLVHELKAIDSEKHDDPRGMMAQEGMMIGGNVGME